ncbi:tRNA (guanine(9)-N(1))-methyltransferase [Puccinia graminis f. sp. tritici]|uniref:tRNA (guanine(9)-N1)-methyltransferase n=1 Tax=Puccinia graminis f. sp. tritici TaxID=56615 RepID=A0A5B0S851_PUCGR|nr:tRNA (guanine(9)-N(1))-methyltransferase [Puccinia graminis f. sp. tritici]KAA1134037.1 tRNA (guanine(9)-N(1))-methyltransferase [Puccinia graminis f. sp. tritici]
MNSPTSSSQEIEEPLKGTSTTRIKQEEDNNSNQLSKKQLKRQLKRQLILDERPAKRAAERARKKAKKLESKNSTTPKQQEDGGNSNKQKPVIFPATVVFDCRFDDKMSDKEIVSLDRQIAHSYSINRKANVQFKSLVCTSFNGRLRTRFQQNGNQYLRWKSVQFTDQSIEDLAFSKADSERAADPAGTRPSTDDDLPKPSPKEEEEQRKTSKEGEEESPQTLDAQSAPDGPAADQDLSKEDQAPKTEQVEEQRISDLTHQKLVEDIKPEGDQKLDRTRPEALLIDPQNVIYLSADSSNILTTIEPDKVYVIGSIVDHNRHKNLCLDLATNQAFQHAQLPIAEHFSQLKTRKVLTVNQVFEILVNYLVDQDWKIAFERVIPSRKL